MEVNKVDLNMLTFYQNMAINTTVTYFALTHSTIEHNTSATRIYLYSKSSNGCKRTN